MKKLGIGVIGTGFMGQMHASIFHDLPNAELIGVTDQDPQRAKDLADKLGVKAFEHYHSLLKCSDIEAVSICVSDHNHLEPTIASSEAGKHIFLEKPIATCLEDANTILKATIKNNVRLTVGHLLRFDPKYLLLKQYVDEGGIGQPISIYTHRNSLITDGPVRYGHNGCLTLHVAVHDMDLILWIMKKKVVRVYAERVSIALKNIGIDDAISATLKFEDGSIACMQYNWVLPSTFPTHIDAKMEIIGTKGYAAVDCANQGICTCGNEGYRLPEATHWPELRGQVRGDLREELSAFVDAILNKKEFAITPQESINAVKLALAIMQSITEERVVIL